MLHKNGFRQMIEMPNHLILGIECHFKRARAKARIIDKIQAILP